MTIDLREFRVSHYADVRRLWESAEGVGLSEGDSHQGVARLLDRNPGLSWIAVDGSDVVGAILCGHDGRRGMIYHLAVATSHRRRGVATRLVQAAFASLHSVGIEQCYAMAYTHNEPATAFWKSLGCVLRADLNLFRTSVSAP